MRLFAFILFYFFCANIKAQDNQAKPLKFVITAEMQNEMDNDTTGKYRIGIPPKRVIEAAATKTELDNRSKQNEINITTAPITIPQVAPRPLTKEDSLFMEEKKAYNKKMITPQ